MELFRESRPIDSELPEKIEPVEPVDTHRERGGHAPIAGVGDMVGDGHSRRSEGRSGVSCVVAMVAGFILFLVNYAIFEEVVESFVLQRKGSTIGVPVSRAGGLSTLARCSLPGYCSRWCLQR
jgi:hypothetical protein